MYTPQGRSRTFALALAVCLSAFPASCTRSPPPIYANSHLADVTAYPVTTTRRTPAGIEVDDPRGQLNDATVDRQVAELEACIAALPARWTTEQAQAGQCLSLDVPRAINRAGIVVKVAPDWSVSACSGEWVFPCSIDPKHCEVKGLSGPCPCACRSIVQGHRVIVTTPALINFRGEVARLVTGCNGAWYLLALAACLS